VTDALYFSIVWDSLQAHKDFEAQDSYKPFAQKFLSLAGGKPTIVHADFEPHSALEAAVAAPVTEVATFVFEGAIPDGYASGLEAFRSAAETQAASSGYKGASFGFVKEEVEVDGVKGPAAVLAIGWESIDAHLAFRETQTFKDNIHHLRTGVKASSIHHVQFLNFVS
jgi:heme-degrading monooxygenase HmoA